MVITGGGTGGHLVIAKAIKEELNNRGIKPIFIGSTYGQDKEWFEFDEGWEAKYFFDTNGVVNKKGIKKLISLNTILKYTFQTKNIFKKHNITKVFSVGGYSAAPASFGAILFNKPLFIHEQNAYMGKLNKILTPFAKRIFNTFLYNDPYPLRDEFFKKARVRKEIKTLIFLGGSQGAKAINDFAMQVAKTKKYKIIHQTGKRDYKRCEKFYKENNLEVDYFAFSSNIVDKISKADFAISRAGASTLFELSANQIPTLFVPYPYAAGNHQYYNAKFLADKNLAFLKLQNELNLDIFDEIKNIDIISKKLKEINSINGAKFIVDEILKDKNRCLK
jgi:UDP-N-acetylglucosamine--N-acetylmuramyl-(pentapeptide) pyrophosphoryl-undecaprenol N-acetylglucosamine transferase